MLQTIAEMWAGYRDAVLPYDAPPIQVTETRRAFYAGAWALIQEQKLMAALGVSDDEGAVELARIEHELKEFAALVATGRDGDH